MSRWPDALPTSGWGRSTSWRPPPLAATAACSGFAVDSPKVYLASNDPNSLEWRKDFIRTYLERDVPLLGPRIPAETLERLWTMLAHEQAALLNASRPAASLMIGAQTVTRYIDLLVDLLLIRRLRPFHINAGKRLVRSPKVYVRDSGIVHALLGIGDFNALSAILLQARVGKASRSKTSLPPRLAAPFPVSIAPRLARKSISFWRFRDTAAGLSISNEAARRSPKEVFIWPSRT